MKEANQEQSSKDDKQEQSLTQKKSTILKQIHNEIVKIRKWVVFFGILVIISLVTFVVLFFRGAIEAGGSSYYQ